MSSAMADIGVGNANNAAVGYFVDQKKGEVNELKMVLAHTVTMFFSCNTVC